MHANAGRYLGGIRTLEDLRQRCFISPDTQCWHWRLCMTQNAPKVHMLAPDTGKKVAVKGRRAALWLARGRDLPAGHMAYRRHFCTSADCVNPEHSACGTPKAWGKERRQGPPVVPAHVRSQASLAAWDRRGRKVTPAMVREIRTSTEPQAKLAKRLGISEYCVWDVRTGRSHKHVPPFVNLQAALMAPRLPGDEGFRAPEGPR